MKIKYKFVNGEVPEIEVEDSLGEPLGGRSRAEDDFDTENENEIKTLSIDLETFSDIDLEKCGVYKYCESLSFEILLFGCSVNSGSVSVFDLALGGQIPEDILTALTDESVIKWDFNTGFERICLSTYLRRKYPRHFFSYSIPEDMVGRYLDPSSWRCSMTGARTETFLSMRSRRKSFAEFTECSCRGILRMPFDHPAY